MTTFESLQVIIGFGLLAVAVRGVIIAAKQLSSIAGSSKSSARANQNSNFLALLSLESAVADARKNVVVASARIADLGTQPDETAVEFAKLMYNEAKEQYLNITDRLCTCIIRGQVNESIYRRDYRPWIAEIVRKYADELGPDTRHPNVLRVHQAWADDRSAVDPSIETPS